MRVLLVPNTQNDMAVAAAAELATWLGGIGAEPIMVHGDAELTGMSALAVSPSDIGHPALAVALGGDGTILKAFHVLNDLEIPLLGVKFGRLGFLSGAVPATMRDAVEAALAGEARIERRATLRADVFMGSRMTGSYRALNEVVVSRGESGRVISLDVTIDDHRIAALRGDGLIVATATGSTAYALSAGGPVVAPEFGGLVVVPVAPHTLQSRAIVTGASDVVEVSLSEAARRDACVVVDGDMTPCRQPVERVVVRRGEHDVMLAKVDGRDFYETAAEEFFGG